ncbi:MAG: hypothetical protein MMC33_005703 [Icmadophila ericetorum]|nr:hypothetical protein [Icmadophila ericetorum]
MADLLGNAEMLSNALNGHYLNNLFSQFKWYNSTPTSEPSIPVITSNNLTTLSPGGFSCLYSIIDPTGQVDSSLLTSGCFGMYCVAPDVSVYATYDTTMLGQSDGNIIGQTGILNGSDAQTR